MKPTYLKLVLQTFAIFITLPLILAQRTIVLDKSSDVFGLWKIQGSFDYYPNGYQLNHVSRDFLPPDFDFKPFRTTKGVWLIIPDTFLQVISGPAQKPNYNSTTALNNNSGPGARYETETVNKTVSFTFRSAAQLMESVGVRYCLYGKARIHIKKGQTIIYTIAPSETPAYEWIDSTFPLDGSNQFTVEANVGNPMDFVLIDRITGFYSEVTTSSTSPRPTTSPRTHPPKSNANALLTSPLILGVFALTSGLLQFLH